MGKGNLTKRFRRTALPFAAAMAVVGTASGCWPPFPLEPSPNSPLLDGHEIKVSGARNPPNATISVVQCRTDADSIDDCNGDSATTVHTDDEGHFESTMFVHSSFEDGQGVQVDCLAGPGCDVTSFLIPDGQLQSRFPIYFWDRGGLSVTPDRDLTDGQVVTVRGRSPAESVLVAQCWFAPGNYVEDCGPKQIVPVQDDGTFQTEMTVHTTLQTDIRRVDCRVAGHCVIASDVSDAYGAESPQWSPLEFD